MFIERVDAFGEGGACGGVLVHLRVVEQRLPTVLHGQVGRLLVALPGVVVEGEQARHLGQPPHCVRVQLVLQLLQILGTRLKQHARQERRLISLKTPLMRSSSPFMRLLIDLVKL